MKNIITLILAIGVASFSSMYFDPINVGFSPTALSTAGSFPSRPDGSAAAFYNPALLKQSNFNQVRAFYSSNFDAQYLNASCLFQTGIAPIMLGFANFAISDVPSTFLDNNGVVQKGSSVQNSNTVLAAGTAFEPFGIPLGVTLKMYTSAIDKNTATGFNANIGTYFLPNKNLLISLYSVNALPMLNKVSWSSGHQEYLPTTFVLGASLFDPLYTLSFTTAYYDAFTENADHIQWSVGATLKLMGLNINGIVGKDTIRSKDTYFAAGIDLDLGLLATGACMAPSGMESGAYTTNADIELNFGIMESSENDVYVKPNAKKTITSPAKKTTVKKKPVKNLMKRKVIPAQAEESLFL